MYGVSSRGGSLRQAMVAVSQAVPSAMRPIKPAVVQETADLIPPVSREKTIKPQTFTYTKASISLAGTTQMRFAHTDISIPDFSDYRRTSKPGQDSSDVNSSRKLFTYLMVAGGTIPSVYAGKTVVTQFVNSMNASADVLAMAKIEVNLDDIPEGKNVVFKWRNKPLFIRHRSEEEVERERAVDLSVLRHQEHDNDRIQKPEWLILLGVCTHLGCVPIANAGDYGGYYCPCHGSHYDGSGRIRKGPAPLNLEVPEYNFPDDSTVVVG